MSKKREKKQGQAPEIRQTPRKIYCILWILVVLVMGRQIWLGNWNNVFTCLLTLALFALPSIAEHQLKIDLPNLLESIIIVFIFAAEILGEIGEFYINVPHWDTLLHTVNGFLMAAIGFALIDILNQHPRFHFSLSPLFVAFVAFCFSMTIGVLWEFFEYGVDTLLSKDMQKDTILTAISSVKFQPDGRNIPVTIKGITETIIVTGTGETVVHGGYLDVGLVDTMKDLLVNFVGAVVFSTIGYFYIKGRAKMPAKLIPRMLTEEEVEASETQRRESADARRRARAVRRSNWIKTNVEAVPNDGADEKNGEHGDK